MKIKEIKTRGRKSVTGEEFNVMLIFLVFLMFVFSLGFLNFGLKLLLSGAEIQNSINFLGDYSGRVINFTASFFCLLLTIIFFSPGIMGTYRFFIYRTLNSKCSAKMILDCYNLKNIFPSFLSVITYLFINVNIHIFFCAPAIIILLGTFRSLFFEGVYKSVFIIIAAGSSALLIVSLIFSQCVSSAFCAFPYIRAINPKVKISSAIRASKRIMQGRYLKFFLFKMSFFPFLLSCIFIFPIFFFLPYYLGAKAEFILNAVNDQKGNK